MSPPRRLVIVHHRLIGFVGHRCQEALGLVAEAPRRGFVPLVFISRRATPEVRAAFPGARAVLHDPVFGPGSFDERTGDFVAMLREHLDAEVGAADVVLMTVATQCEVRAFAIWLAGIPCARRPRVVFLFHNDRWNRGGPPEYARQVAEMRVVATELARDPAVAARLVFGAVTAGVAREVSLLLGVRASETPLTHTYAGIPRPAADDAPNDPPIVGFLSGARMERGARDVPALLDACRRRMSVGFLVHLLDEVVEPEVWRALEALADASDVEVVRGELHPSVYGALVARSDVVLLPYDRAAYRQRQSAMLADAVVVGRPVVVPSGTWPGEIVRSGAAAGLTYDGGVEAAADAVAQCVRRLPDLRARARELGPAWAARQSLPAFLDWMDARLSAAAPT